MPTTNLLYFLLFKLNLENAQIPLKIHNPGGTIQHRDWKRTLFINYLRKTKIRNLFAKVHHGYSTNTYASVIILSYPQTKNPTIGFEPVYGLLQRNRGIT